jgi:hypothetical protein
MRLTLIDTAAAITAVSRALSMFKDGTRSLPYGKIDVLQVVQPVTAAPQRSPSRCFPQPDRRPSCGQRCVRLRNIISNMATQAAPPSAVCPNCGKVVDPSDPFCRHCGLALLPRSQAALVDTYVTTKVDQVLADRLASEDSLVRAIGDKAEDVVMRRFRNYGILLGLGIAAIGWLGWHSFSDITASAKLRLDPIVADAESRAAEAQKTKKSTDDLSTEVDQQRGRVNTQTGELGKKIEDLQRDTDNARNNLEKFRHRMDPSFSQIPRLQNDRDIAIAFPNLDIEPSLNVGNVAFDKSLKKPGEIFVDVNISYSAMAKGVIPTEKLKQLIAKLKTAGITPTLGMPMLSGRANMGKDCMDLVWSNVHPSVVLYIDPANKALADKLVEIASEFVTFPNPQTQLVHLPAPSTSSNDGLVAMIWAKSGFDAQIFISAP